MLRKRGIERLIIIPKVDSEERTTEGDRKKSPHIQYSVVYIFWSLLITIPLQDF